MTSNPKIYFRLIALVIGLQTLSSRAFAQNAGAQQGPTQTFSFFLPLLLVFAIFYLLVIRPQQKQAKKHQQMLQAIQKGDQVILSGGMHGKVTGIADNILTVEITDNVRVKVERSGVQTVKTESSVERRT